jgi:hypothetical protein
VDGDQLVVNGKPIGGRRGGSTALHGQPLARPVERLLQAGNFDGLEQVVTEVWRVTVDVSCGQPNAVFTL